MNGKLPKYSQINAFTIWNNWKLSRKYSENILIKLSIAHQQCMFKTIMDGCLWAINKKNSYQEHLQCCDGIQSMSRPQTGTDSTFSCLCFWEFLISQTQSLAFEANLRLWIHLKSAVLPVSSHDLQNSHFVHLHFLKANPTLFAMHFCCKFR